MVQFFQSEAVWSLSSQLAKKQWFGDTLKCLGVFFLLTQPAPLIILLLHNGRVERGGGRTGIQRHNSLRYRSGTDGLITAAAPGGHSTGQTHWVNTGWQLLYVHKQTAQTCLHTQLACSYVPPHIWPICHFRELFGSWEICSIMILVVTITIEKYSLLIVVSGRPSVPFLHTWYLRNTLTEIRSPQGWTDYILVVRVKGKGPSDLTSVTC